MKRCVKQCALDGFLGIAQRLARILSSVGICIYIYPVAEHPAGQNWENTKKYFQFFILFIVLGGNDFLQIKNCFFLH